MADRLARPAPFVGRTEELAVLGDALDAVRSGELVPVLISGEPGIGKTRLARQFTEPLRSEGTAVHWGRCVELGGAPPFWPWIQALRSLGGVAAAEPLRAPDQPDADRFAAFEAVADLLRAAAVEPMVLVLDDLHVADLASLELLRFLTRAASDVPLLVIGTHRAHELRLDAERDGLLGEVARAGRRIEPGALGRSEVEAFVELAGLGPVAAAVVDEVLRRSGGNALYVDELVQAMVRGGPAALDGIPQGVRSAVRLRMEPLPEDTRLALAAAAVLGARIDARVLAGMLDVAPIEIAGRLGPALDHGLLVAGDDGALGFSHVLVREALFESLAGPTRTRMHLDAARALADVYGTEAQARPAAVAEHLVLADGAVDAADAARWAERAAAEARTLRAPEEAARWSERAARWHGEAGRAGAEFEALLGAATDWAAAGRADRSVDVAELALTLARGSGSGRWLARAVLARVAVWDPTQALEGPPLLREALAHPDNRDDRPWRAQLLAPLVTLLGMPSIDGRPIDGEGARAALAELRGVIDGDDHDNVLPRLQLVIEHGPDRHADRRRWLAQLAPDRHLPLGPRAEWEYWATSLAFEAGDLPEVARGADEWERLARLGPTAFMRWRAATAKASLAYARGRFVEAEERAMAALPLVSGLYPQMAARVADGLLFTIRFDQGRLEEVVDGLSEERLGMLALVVPMWRGDTAGVARLLEPLLAAAQASSPQELYWLCAMSVVARGAAFVGDGDRCRWAIGQLAPYGDQCVMWGRSYVFGGPVSELLGLLHHGAGQAAEAAAQLRRTIAWADAMDAPGFGVRGRLGLASVLDEDDRELSALLHRSAADAARLGMARALAQAELRLAGLAEPVAAPPPGSSIDRPAVPGERPRLRTLGGFAVVPVGFDEPARWSSKKARDTLKILVCQRGRAISREELIDLLWRDVDLVAGRARLSVVLSIVRAAFDPAKRWPKDHVVRADRQSVALRLENVDVDVERFLRLADAGLGRLAAGSDESAHAVLTAAVDEAWGGPFLVEDRYEDWSFGLRATVDSAYVAALRALVHLAQDAGDADHVVARASQLIDHDPYDEEAHRALVAALELAGRRREAGRQRDAFAARMRELGLPPPEWAPPTTTAAPTRIGDPPPDP